MSDILLRPIIAMQVAVHQLRGGRMARRRPSTRFCSLLAVPSSRALRNASQPLPRRRRFAGAKRRSGRRVKAAATTDTRSAGRGPGRLAPRTFRSGIHGGAPNRYRACSRSRRKSSSRSALARVPRRAAPTRAVAGTKKPPLVVLAVNRAARDRPQAAKDAVSAAERLGPAQLSGDADRYRDVLKQMEQASMLLADVAVANLSRGKRASETTRRRVAELLRGALAGKETRQRLVRGALVDEVGAAGFDAFAGVPMPARTKQGAQAKPSDPDRSRRAREALRAEIEESRCSLDDVERRLREASRERDKVARKLAALEAKRDRSQRRD